MPQALPVLIFVTALLPSISRCFVSHSAALASTSLRSSGVTLIVLGTLSYRLMGASFRGD
jgi:uncharacterized protein YjeT (DUF2065 family)